MKKDEAQKHFVDAYLQEEPYHSICYRSGLTVYEESLIGGRYVSSGWNGSGYPLSVVNMPDAALRLRPENFTMPQAFQLEMDGQFLGSHWEWAGFDKVKTEGGLHVMVLLKHMVRPVSVAVHTLLDGTPVLTRWIEITNDSGNIAALGALAPISGALQTTGGWEDFLREDSPLYHLGYMEYARPLNEGNFQWHALPNAGYGVYGKFRRERHRHPMFILKNEATGEVFTCQFAWSGGFAFEFDLNADTSFGNTAAHLGFKVAMDAFAPLRTLAPHETVKSPGVHIGMLFGGLDDAVQGMHDHIRKSVFTPKIHGKSCWVEAGIGPEVEMTEEMTMRLVDDAAYLGAEVFFIDAGWYVKNEMEWADRCGDWHVSKDRYKNGLAPIREKVRKNGMRFGLWMDAERIGNMSETARNHPDWIVRTYCDKRSEGDMLDLTNPEAASWMESEITRVIEENDLDFFRLDYNVSGFDTLSFTKREGFVENNFWRYYEAAYDLFDRLRARFPDVIFENCASGGGRTDLGMVSRFNHTWVTDWQIAPRAFSITSGMTMALPPEHVDRLIAGQGGYVTASLAFQARLLLFARPTLGSFYPYGAEMNRKQMEYVRDFIRLYKDFVRPFMLSGKIYHHTPVFKGIEPKGWGILELASDDSTKGIVGIFQLSNPLEQETVVRLRGVDVAKRYEVTLDNCGRTTSASGYALANDGVRVRLEGALTSELIIYRENIEQ